eukprot:COSAG01_NODE_9222_length_2514_cov_1.659213_3_plen_99_part_00
MCSERCKVHRAHYARHGCAGAAAIFSPQFALRCSCWLDSLHFARILAVPTATCPSCLTRGLRKVAACVNFFVLLLRLLCARSSKNPGCSACRYIANMG